MARKREPRTFAEKVWRSLRGHLRDKGLDYELEGSVNSALGGPTARVFAPSGVGEATSPPRIYVCFMERAGALDFFVSAMPEYASSPPTDAERRDARVVKETVREWRKAQEGAPLGYEGQAWGYRLRR